MLTYGRHPTLDEVCDYYARPDFLRFLHETTRHRQVLMIVPAALHWEPDPKADRVPDLAASELSDFVLGRIRERLPTVAPDQRPPFYPSFHQSVDFWPPDQVDGARPLGCDGVCEADLPTWQLSFSDVFTLVNVLREEHVPHRYKFSGHRSLHLVVPFADGKLRAQPFGDSCAHGVRILRMPYSLNEDTGLVSLPLTWEALPAFRPWQANLHLVTIRDDWLAPDTPDDRERVMAFLAGLPQREPVPRRAYFLPPAGLEQMQAIVGQPQVRTLAGEGALADVWRQLCGLRPITEADLHAALTAGDVDRRWLTTEAMVLHGQTLSVDVLPSLLASDDVYLRPAVLDLLARFPEPVGAYFAAALAADDLSHQARVLAVLAQLGRLEGELRNLLARGGNNGTMVLRLACVMGTTLQDWPGAWQLVEAAAPQCGQEPDWATRVAALRQMEQMTRHPWDQEPHSRGLALAALGPAVIDLILLAIAPAQRHLRLTYVVALSKLADVRALSCLIEHLGSRYRDASRWAIHGLLDLGAVAVPALIEAAASDESRLRRYAVRCLAHGQDPRAHETLVTALTDSDETVCRQAMLGVAKGGRAADAPAIAATVRGREWQTAQAAVTALLTMGEAGQAQIAQLAAGGEPAALRLAWRNGDLQARAGLLAGLTSADRHRHSGAVMALLEQPLDEEAMALIAHGLEADPNPDWELGVAIEAMAAAGGPLALAQAAKWAHTDHGGLRRMAARVLAAWNGPEAGPLLLELLAGTHHSTRECVVRALWARRDLLRPQLAAAAASAEQHTVTRRIVAALLAGDQALTRLAGGETFTAALARELFAAAPWVFPATAEILLARHQEQELAVIGELILTAKSGTRHWAGQLALAVGEPLRPYLERWRGEATGKPREVLVCLLAELDRQLEAGAEDEAANPAPA